MPKTAEIRRQNRGQAAENGEKRQDIKRAGNPNRQEGEPARTVTLLGAAQTAFAV